MKNVFSILLAFVGCASLHAFEDGRNILDQGQTIDRELKNDGGFCLEKGPSFRKYVSVNLTGLPFLLAQFKVGLRKDDARLGYDFGLTGCKSKSYGYFGGYGSLLYIFNGEGQSKYYIGGGIGVVPHWNDWYYGIWGGPEFSFGHSRVSASGRHDFFQFNFSGPQISYFQFSDREYANSKFSNKYSISLDYGLFF